MPFVVKFGHHPPPFFAIHLAIPPSLLGSLAGVLFTHTHTHTHTRSDSALLAQTFSAFHFLDAYNADSHGLSFSNPRFKQHS